MMTAHDYPSGVFIEKSNLDTCLVGDSLAMVALGYENTNKITMDVRVGLDQTLKGKNSLLHLINELDV